MRKSTTKVLGIPITVSTKKLMQLGVHNATLELIEAQRSAQVVRLFGSRAGRRLLEAADLRPTFSREKGIQLDLKVRGTYVVDSFPRNVHPQGNK